MAKVNANKIRESKGDVVLDVITSIILVLITFIVAYPVIFVISCSFSSSKALEAGRVVLWPVDFSLDAYKFILNYEQVWTGFRNSIFYTICDVFKQMTFTTLMAYPLSRRWFQGRGVYTWYFYLTGFIGGGLIPGFILKCNLGLYDNIWAVLLGGAFEMSHVLILRTAISSNIPGDLFDAAMIDGASHFQCAFRLAIPLCKATISVLILYCIVGQWNEYFTSMLYLRNKELYPLQLVLRPIMTAASAMNQMDTSSMPPLYQQMANEGLEGVRYALIFVSSGPIIATYFVVQKYFKGGMMVGSVKG